MFQDKLMQDKVLNAFSEQAKSFYDPLRKMNTLMVDNMQKMANFQMDAVKSYSQMSLSQAKNTVAVKDAEGFRDLSASQVELMTTFGKKIQEDTKTLTDMSMKFKVEVEQLMKDARDQATSQTVAKS